MVADVLREIRGLTVQQPYAHQLVIGAKRFENRTWATDYRGLLAIHAAALRGNPGAEPWMPYGALVGVCRLADVVRVGALSWTDRQDPHANGPWCWVPVEMRPLPAPIPCRGALGLWRVPPPLRQALVAQLADLEDVT